MQIQAYVGATTQIVILKFCPAGMYIIRNTDGNFALLNSRALVKQTVESIFGDSIRLECTCISSADWSFALFNNFDY